MSLDDSNGNGNGNGSAVTPTTTPIGSDLPSIPPTRRLRLLTDQDAQRLLRIDVKMVHALRRIARGEPIVDVQRRRQRMLDWQRRIDALDLPPHANKPVLDMLWEAFKAGAASTVAPLPIIRSFETLMRAGHSKLWRPADEGDKAPRNVTINIVAGREAKQITQAAASSPIDVTPVESAP